MTRLKAIDVFLEHNGKSYTASYRAGKWLWFFVEGHDHVRGRKIPVPTSVLLEFHRLFPGVVPLNESHLG